MCKSSSGLDSQKPVLAMVTAGDGVPEPGRCSYLSTSVDGGLEQRAAMLPGHTPINRLQVRVGLTDWGGDSPCGGKAGRQGSV